MYLSSKLTDRGSLREGEFIVAQGLRALRGRQERAAPQVAEGLEGSGFLTKLWDIPLCCVNICPCDWFNKEADWSIAG